jgi:hypothetical protein
MKIESGTLLPFSREPVKPAALRANTTAQATDSAKPARADQGGQKTTPPGLERALARLQSIAESERTAGQSNAMDSISRNIARYTETEAISAPPAATTSATGNTAFPETIVA